MNVQGLGQIHIWIERRDALSREVPAAELVNQLVAETTREIAKLVSKHHPRQFN